MFDLKTPGSLNSEQEFFLKKRFSDIGGAIDPITVASYDSDAQAFFTATGITDSTIKTAVNTRVLALKAASLWTKKVADWPMVGGSGTTNKYNLINPATFPLDFQGGWTHSATGSKANGSTGYAKTGIIPATHLSLDSVHLMFYSRTNDDAGFDLGTGLGYLALLCKSGGVMAMALNQAATSFDTNAAGTGHYIATRTGVNTVKGYKGGSVLVSDTNSSTALAAFEIYLSAFNNSDSAANFSAKECAGASVGAALSATDAANLYTIDQVFNTALGRQV